MEIHTTQYIQGFNDGYIIRLFEPTLSQTLVGILPASSDYLMGVRYGILELDKVKILENDFQTMRNKSHENTQEYER
jgi:hypothetical protein